ncbi:MAG: hypothetical protein PVF67_12690, partial [Anaerolineae bacterium]
AQESSLLQRSIIYWPVTTMNLCLDLTSVMVNGTLVLRWGKAQLQYTHLPGRDAHTAVRILGFMGRRDAG